jgi:ABC-2 type transport system ATP-binding protein
VAGIASGASGSARAHIGYIPEAQSIPYEWIKVRDLLSYHARYYATWDNAYAKKLCDALELRMDSKYGKLSKGEARRAELVMALAHRPRLLLMDEPTDGLDPVVRATVLSLLAEHMTESETTMVVATHLVHEMERFADHIGVIADGKLRTQVSREAMQRMYACSSRRRVQMYARYPRYHSKTQPSRCSR